MLIMIFFYGLNFHLLQFAPRFISRSIAEIFRPFQRYSIKFYEGELLIRSFADSLGLPRFQ